MQHLLVYAHSRETSKQNQQKKAQRIPMIAAGKKDDYYDYYVISFQFRRTKKTKAHTNWYVSPLPVIKLKLELQ